MRFFLAAVCMTAMFAFTTSALGGEVTGNGKLNGRNGKSACSFSGQEDLQFFTTNGDGTPIPPDQVVRGDPARVQNWGHTDGRSGGANQTNAFGFEWGCNAHMFPNK
jgi:hypothetical protein